jgi:hypothetical protein
VLYSNTAIYSLIPRMFIRFVQETCILYQKLLRLSKQLTKKHRIEELAMK